VALRAEGGGSANAFLLLFQADLLGIRVVVGAERVTTALGAGALAALALGLRDGPPEPAPGHRYEPELSRDDADRLFAGWQRALGRALH
jgi:glycerol kinase